MTAARRAGWSALAALLLAMLPSLAPAANEAQVTVQRIKAAFLYKFASYVEWPTEAFADASTPIVIAVIGADAIAKELQQAVSGRNVAGRPLQVRRTLQADDAGAPHILFVGSSVEAARTLELLAQVQGRPVLTVTDVAGDPAKGSVINFLELDDRVRFDIRRDAAERNKLQLRSQLLSVARQVLPS